MSQYLGLCVSSTPSNSEDPDSLVLAEDALAFHLSLSFPSQILSPPARRLGFQSQQIVPFQSFEDHANEIAIMKRQRRTGGHNSSILLNGVAY
jgi:hypothetical protein